MCFVETGLVHVDSTFGKGLICCFVLLKVSKDLAQCSHVIIGL